MRGVWGFGIGVVAVISAASAQQPPVPAKTDPPAIPTEKRAELMERIKSAARQRAERPRDERALKIAEHKVRVAKKGKVDLTAPGTAVVPRDDGDWERVTFRSEADKTSEVRKLTEELANLKAVLEGPVTDPARLVPAFTADAKAGTFGRFSSDNARVVRVVDPSTAVIATYFAAPASGAVGDPAGASWDAVPVRCVVSGVNASAMRVNTGTRLPGAFYVAGNRKVGGRTYLDLVPVKFTDKEVRTVRELSKKTAANK